ncbi:hypothetical protein RB2654_14160 [Rhodobacterales bacterium HTCC2654]|uniref:Uncharacterized protein n=1 Tax=Maritimibacter alkaliphilus HTCC2654 TaxID=314271 RepID=A3VGN1_9RHOB|nr:hypothetical protein RB2654_14160 [Rhodobacterales bacterium HTCC2654] [Maritimibacter alkaliphilus HTCC2654]
MIPPSAVRSRIAVSTCGPPIASDGSPGTRSAIRMASSKA